MTDFDGYLLNIGQIPTCEKTPLTKNLENRVWTESKAQLIQRYLRYFVYITKHGTYLDGFSGPQNNNETTSWAAKLVLENRPPWLRNFVLFEKSPASVVKLNQLVGLAQKNQSVTVVAGDTNVELPRHLADNPIKETEATFCLLDQRTFECDWATVETVARHKPAGNKIEIFYFLAAWWFDRSVSGLKRDPETDMTRWWGRPDWRKFSDMSRRDRPDLLKRRFREELGYRYADAYPIFEKPESPKIMFYMVHASDHPDARPLMVRAYNRTLGPGQFVEQSAFDFFAK